MATFPLLVGDENVPAKIRALKDGDGDVGRVFGDIQTGFFISSVEDAITASPSQTQAGGTPLIAQANIITNVATPEDSCTLIKAVAGMQITVSCEAANPLMLFPFLGDDMGLGVNQGILVRPGVTGTLKAANDLKWTITSATTVISTAIIDEDNVIDFDIHAPDEFHGLHSLTVSGDQDGFIFHAGSAGVPRGITSISDAGGGIVTVQLDGAHTITEVGQVVTQTDLSNAVYVDPFFVTAIPSASSYSIAAAFAGTDTGFMDQPATVTLRPGLDGRYSGQYGGSAKGSSNNQTYNFQLYLGVTVIAGTKCIRKYATGGDFGGLDGGKVGITIMGGNLLWLGVSNDGGSAAIDIRHLNVDIVRLG